jgi:hypothetical protein
MAKPIKISQYTIRTITEKLSVILSTGGPPLVKY